MVTPIIPIVVRLQYFFCVKLKEMYPNSSVVTVYYTSYDGKTHQKSYSDDYTMNLVKDSTNRKIEVRIGYGISVN